jgi:NAD(P)H dehydrogenase (quinone)
MARIAVIYYSSTGHVHQLATAVGEGAESAGGDVRLRLVAELAPEEAIRANPAWQRFREEVATQVPEATLGDLEWAEGYALGTPTRFGNPTAQLKQFIDQCGPLWARGVLADKAATSFTSAMNAHGGSESTILALNNVFYHWGALVVPPGYTDQRLFASGGNPYGTTWTSGQEVGAIDEATRASARIQGERLAVFAKRICDGRRDTEDVPAEQAEAYTAAAA